MISHSQAQPRLLDGLEDVTGWRAITSEGAKLSISSAKGKNGNALQMAFDLRGVSGYVIAQKDFDLDLPDNYQFTFDMRGDTPPNNFEFKLLDDQDDVYWVKKLNIEYPVRWTRQRITRRQISFAWGPHPGRPLAKVKKVEFVVSCGTGGKGTVWIDNFQFAPISVTAAQNARATVSVSSVAPGSLPAIDPRGSAVTGWRSAGMAERESLTVSFGRIREIGGAIIDWDSSDYATSYDVLLSDDGQVWSPGYTVTRGNGGRDYIPLSDGEGAFLKIVCAASALGKGYAIQRMEVKGPDFSSTDNDLFGAIAADSPPGYFPKYFSKKQSYWTVMGVEGDSKKALMNEQGQIEVDRGRFSLEPFLYINGRLVTWNDVTTTPSLLGGDLPIPSVTWHYGREWTLRIEGVAAGVPGNSMLGVEYSIVTTLPHGAAKFFVAVRPFQVLPPWQSLNMVGGACRIDSIVNDGGIIDVDGVRVIPMTPPVRFGAAGFDRGSVTDDLAAGTLPGEQSVHDHFGHASAALEYDVMIRAGEQATVILAVPFHGWREGSLPPVGGGMAPSYSSLMREKTALGWESKIGTVKIHLPRAAGDIASTLSANLAYILTDRDGPALQPGARTYARSWIRDGSLIASALLQLGHPAEVRGFLDWYAGGQFPNGKIPCVMDARGPDAVPEHDSNGEFIYAVLNYFRFTRDTLWLRGKFDAVARTVRYIQSLRAERKTDQYKNGTPGERALYGLVTESISHEGYSDHPRHSYWDDFFVLRGLKDAAAIAAVLGRKEEAAAFARERDDFRMDLYASMRLAMRNRHIDYIPGCAELGDFDPTSTAIGVSPGGELGNIPEPQLHNTFDRYYRFFSTRRQTNDFRNYTPYETRVIGAFVMLGQKERAKEALDFFMEGQRPAGWRQWPEVVWRNPDTAAFIGDIPHTWVGSDFIRSVLTMFAFEREKDGSLVLAAGIPDSWVKDSAGVGVDGLRTAEGAVTFRVHARGRVVTAVVAGDLDTGHHAVVFTSPLSERLRGLRVNGKRAPVPKSREVRLGRLPVTLEFRY